MNPNVTKNIKKSYKVLLFMLIVCISFTGCTWNSILDHNTSEGLESGFEFSAPDIPPGAHVPPTQLSHFCAYKSDKSEFNINFVVLDFYYGGEFSENLESYKKHTQDFPEFELYFGYTSGEKIVVKRVRENFVSEKYRCETVRDERHFVRKVKYNYSEKLRIPKRLFTEENGILIFGLQGINRRYEEPRMEHIASIAIYYKVVGNILTGRRVILSSNPFE